MINSSPEERKGMLVGAGPWLVFLLLLTSGVEIAKEESHGSLGSLVCWCSLHASLQFSGLILGLNSNISFHKFQENKELLKLNYPKCTQSSTSFCVICGIN